MHPSVTYSTGAVFWKPLHTLIAPFPAACFTLALLTDVAYWQTSNLMWQNFSSWLILAGVVTGVLAGLVFLLEVLLRPLVRAARSSWWPQSIAGLLVLVVAFFNGLVHAGDGWTAVVPVGLALSAATVALIVVTVWFDRATTLTWNEIGAETHDR